MSNDNVLPKSQSAARSGPAFVSWRVQSWREAVTLAEGMHGWLFRGQENSTWGLTTSLERTAKIFHCPQLVLPEQEEEIINQFKRQAHQYLQSLPADEKNLEWLSLIQHHSGPTRLLDFTRSFYVAAFFAMETAQQDSVVWAINQQLLDAQFIGRTELYEEAGHKPTIAEAKCRTVERCVRRSFGPRVVDHSFSEPTDHEPDPILDQPNVVAVKPWFLNQRLIIQQGWFLFPTSLDTTFEHNLCKALGVPGTSLPEKTPVDSLDELTNLIADPQSNLALVRMNFPREIHLEAIRDLYRMNITAATLFPGLDGFARSLRHSLRIFDGFETTEVGK